jgi:hypothetical protein
MHPKRLLPIVKGRGAVQRPKGTPVSKYSVLSRLVSGGLFIPLLLGGTLTAFSGNPLGDIGMGEADFGIYAHGSAQEIADCRVEKIFMDHRRMGFFHVQLLPLLVVQGVRLELDGVNADGEWVEGFRTDWFPDIKHNAMEWRDVSVSVKTDNAPSIHADRAIPVPGVPDVVCKLENITIKTRGATQRVARAELRNEAGRPRVVWHADGVEYHWDLFKGELANPKPTTTEAEK